MRRATRTAELAGFVHPELTDLLREVDYGAYEGLTSKQIQEANPDWELYHEGSPGGESPAQIYDRAQRFIELAARIRQGRVLAFAHGHILRVVTARRLELEVAAGAHFKLETASIGVLGHERQTPVLERWSI